MDRFIIHGGRKLRGEVSIGGSKNAALPFMAASLLTQGETVITNVPELRDVRTMAHLLRIIGARVERKRKIMRIDTGGCSFFEAPYELVKTMRASIYVLGPLLTRYGKVRVSLPGGCAWGPRPVNFHLDGLKKMGARIDLEGGYIIAKARRLKGARIHLDVSSVGATGNLLMAAVLAKGTTVIENAAEEPEIVELELLLKKMGAKIDGIGTTRLEIEGTDDLQAVKYRLIPDRIEAGTFLLAGAITEGSITLKGVNPTHMEAVVDKLSEAGCTITITNSKIHISCSHPLQSIDITTAVYPGFPTDIQAQWTALMSVTEGTSIIRDTIYTDRFNHVPELRRLGADIQVEENTAIIRGVKNLTGAPVMSTDLRASASLILAGLRAQGCTEVLRIYHIDRGYERIEEKLQKLGADIKRESGELY